MADEIKLKINGIEVRTSKGATVLEAAQAAGIYIPTLCFDHDLEPYGSCRLCIVEIEGMRGLPTACTTPATNGMVVHTETAAVNEVRRTVIDLLIADHPMDCLTCRKNQQCDLQKVASYLGITERRFPQSDRAFPVDTSNPFFDLDRNYCILCAKCVRTCDEITGIGAIDLAFRGYPAKVATFNDKPLIESICKSCGECMVRCPVGALRPKENIQPTREVKTTCPYCGVGCQMYLGIKGERVVKVSGDRDNDVNTGRLCIKGRFGIAEFIHHSERLSKPLIRQTGEFAETTWNKALNEVASKLGHYQPDEVAIISSAKCTNEENYAIQKLGRAVLGTHNIDHCARL